MLKHNYKFLLNSVKIIEFLLLCFDSIDQKISENFIILLYLN